MTTPIALHTRQPASAAHDETEERIRLVLDSLVLERQALRHSGVDAALLEANRLAIVYWQQRLSLQLIDEACRPRTAA